MQPGTTIGQRVVIAGPLSREYRGERRIMLCLGCSGTKEVDASELRNGKANSCAGCYRKRAKRGGW
ncbi:MAG: hypothetical protein EOP08_14780 [Proteobacteria bacterium]|nr:MAG: hypothetical protein EOP08_14780 [Pseudomonadota bacterium]